MTVMATITDSSSVASTCTVRGVRVLPANASVLNTTLYKVYTEGAYVVVDTYIYRPGLVYYTYDVAGGSYRYPCSPKGYCRHMYREERSGAAGQRLPAQHHALPGEVR